MKSRRGFGSWLLPLHKQNTINKKYKILSAPLVLSLPLDLPFDFELSLTVFMGILILKLLPLDHGPHLASDTSKGFRPRSSLIFYFYFLSTHHRLKVPMRVFTNNILSFLFLLTHHRFTVSVRIFTNKLLFSFLSYFLLCWWRQVGPTMWNIIYPLHSYPQHSQGLIQRSFFYCKVAFG